MDINILQVQRLMRGLTLLEKDLMQKVSSGDIVEVAGTPRSTEDFDNFLAPAFERNGLVKEDKKEDNQHSAVNAELEEIRKQKADLQTLHDDMLMLAKGVIEVSRAQPVFPSSTATAITQGTVKKITND